MSSSFWVLPVWSFCLKVCEEGLIKKFLFFLTHVIVPLPLFHSAIGYYQNPKFYRTLDKKNLTEIAAVQSI